MCIHFVYLPTGVDCYVCIHFVYLPAGLDCLLRVHSLCLFTGRLRLFVACAFTMISQLGYDLMTGKKGKKRRKKKKMVLGTLFMFDALFYGICKVSLH